MQTKLKMKPHFPAKSAANMSLPADPRSRRERGCGGSCPDRISGAPRASRRPPATEASPRTARQSAAPPFRRVQQDSYPARPPSDAKAREAPPVRAFSARKAPFEALEVQDSEDSETRLLPRRARRAVRIAATAVLPPSGRYPSARPGELPLPPFAADSPSARAGQAA